MIITRTPFRISFFGGGTDYPAYFRKYGGAVLSTSINKYCYLSVRYLSPLWDYHYRVRYTDREETKLISEIKHPSARECLNYLDFHRDLVEIQHNSDLPALTGLGASSAFTVGLLHGLYALRGIPVNKKKLAREAIHVEQKLIGENVGSQDQVAAAVGGFNKIEFLSSDEINIIPVRIDEKRKADLQSHLLLAFTGQSRFASAVAAEQIQNTEKKHQELSTMGEMVNEGLNILASNQSLESFGKLLHESWLLKRSLSSQITNPVIDEMYEKARSAGAIGGKLLGAGGGGFLLIFARPELHSAIKEKLGSVCIPFKFENTGSTVIYKLEA